MFQTALLLAHGHIGDLMADADRERKADLVRSATTPTGRPRITSIPSSIVTRALRVGRAMPRATAR